MEKLYSIRIKEENNVDLWHPQAQYFSVYDKNNQFREVFIDLYARPHKRDGAWMDECRSRYFTDTTKQYPVAFLTCNFMRPAENQPALLTHDDVITYFTSLVIACITCCLLSTYPRFPAPAVYPGTPLSSPVSLWKTFAGKRYHGIDIRTL